MPGRANFSDNSRLNDPHGTKGSTLTTSDAAKRLSETTRGKVPNIPWAQIAGPGDIAIHGYDRLDPERTWGLVLSGPPGLKRAVRSLSRPVGRPK